MIHQYSLNSIFEIILLLIKLNINLEIYYVRKMIGKLVEKEVTRRL
jgi:hypothetical protein